MRCRLALFCICLFTLPAFCRADTPPVQDIFIGNGTPGPFTLRWNTISAYSETVSVNQIVQLRNLDYTLDAAAGTVTFTHALPASAAIAVTYTLLPGQSQHSGGGQTIPLSVDLMRNQHSYFSLDALGKQTAGTRSALSLGVGLGWNGGQNNQLASRFAYTPATASDPASKADRTGLSLSGSAGTGRWGVFSVGFSRAGAGLDTSSDSSFQAGRQCLTLGSTLTPVKAVQAQLSFTRSTATDSADSAALSTNESLALTVTPSDKTKMQASLDQATAGTSGTTQTLALSVDTQAAKTVQVSAALNSQNQPGTTSDSQTINLQTTVTPNQMVSVQTSADQSRLGAATTDQQSVTLALTPKPAIQLSAGFLLRQKSADGSPDTLGTSEATVNGTIHPLSVLEVSGSYKSRMAPLSDTNPGDQLDTSTARVAFTPLKTIKLIGTYAQNPDDGTDTLQRLSRHGVGLETTLGALGLSGGCDWSRTYGTPDVEQTIHADLGLRFSAVTQLSVGYQTCQNLLDPTVPLATAYTVGFTHSLGDCFSLSLTGKRRQAATTASPDYNATASLGMKF